MMFNFWRIGGQANWKVKIGANFGALLLYKLNQGKMGDMRVKIGCHVIGRDLKWDRVRLWG